MTKKLYAVRQMCGYGMGQLILFCSENILCDAIQNMNLCQFLLSNYGLI